MSYSDHTTNYELPQFLTSDKGNWFDLNTAFVDIDTGMQANKISAQGANTTANAAKNTAQAAQAAVETVQQSVPILTNREVIKANGYTGTLQCKTYGSIISIYGRGDSTKTAASGSGENIPIGTIVGITIPAQLIIYNAGGVVDSQYKLHNLSLVLNPTNNGTNI